MIGDSVNTRHESYETHRLRQIYNEDGTAAFDRAAVGLLFLSAALIATVEGNNRLGDLIDEVERLHPRSPRLYLDFFAVSNIQ